MRRFRLRKDSVSAEKRGTDACIRQSNLSLTSNPSRLAQPVRQLQRGKSSCQTRGCVPSSSDRLRSLLWHQTMSTVADKDQNSPFYLLSLPVQS